MATKRDLNKEYVNYLSLEESGYRNCVGMISELKTGASKLFQKTVMDSEGNKKYFINVYEFDFSDLKGYVDNTLRYSAEVRFYRQWQDFDVKLHSMDKTTIKQMEEFFNDIYVSMNCNLDHHNN